MQIDLQKAVVALSDALDLVGVDSFHHGKRVAFMVLSGYAQIEPDLSEDQAFQLGLLHDVGVSSTQAHRHLVGELEWANAEQHCRVGADRLTRFTPLAPLAPYVLYHHSRWTELQEQGLDEKIACLANWVFLTDRADVLAASHYQSNILDAKSNIVQTIAKYRGSLFQPELVDLFLEVAQRDSFWLSQEPRHIPTFLAGRTAKATSISLGFEEMRQLARIFAEIVDCKSLFTHQHSLGVAELSRYLAERFGLSSDICQKIEVAGLLHDLGKLQTPDEVLEKPGPLDEHERARINHHSFETFQMLKKIVGFEDIARWAAYHHEKLDGTGYPFRLNEGQLDVQARILAVADVFQSLAQRRPYRAGLESEKIKEILIEFAGDRKLDPDIVNWVASHMEDCYTRALCYQV